MTNKKTLLKSGLFASVAVLAGLAGFLINVSAASAATHYVDFASGSDTNNGTAQTTPWKHVPGMTSATGNAAAYAPASGDTFVFKGGVTWTGSYPWTIRGGSASMVTYTTDHSWFAGSSFAQPVFDDGSANPGGTGMMNMSNGGYVTLNDLTFTKCGVQGNPDMNNKCLVFENAHDVTITNSNFKTYAWISIYFIFDSAGTRNNFTFTGNDFSGTSGAIWMAVAQANTVAGNFIYNNNVFHDFGSQIGNGTHGDGALHWFTLGVANSYINGFQFCNNRFYGDFRRSVGTDGGMTAFLFPEGPIRNGLVCNNDMSFSPVQANMFDSLIVFSTGDANTSVRVVNNTLVDAGTNAMSSGIHFYGNYPGVTMENNIVSGMQYPVSAESSMTNFVSDNNVLSGTSGQFFYNGSFQSYATWQAAGRDTHGKLGIDPSFVGAPGNEHLNSTSPAIGMGANLTSLGIGVLNSDITGKARPASGAWDAGAYSVGSGSGSGGGGDATAPSVSIASPASGATVSGTITVSATASDNIGVTKVEFYLDNVLQTTDTASPYTWSWNTAGVANGSHALSVKAYDAANNVRTSVTVTATVGNTVVVGNTVPDTKAPTVPTGLTVGTVTTSTISLSWIASTDNVGVTGYKIYRGGAQVGTSAATSFTNIGLAASTAYGNTVVAYDATGNVSAQTASVNATTRSASVSGSGSGSVSGTVSLFTTQVPTVIGNDGVNYELGMKFGATTAGQITAIRFYKAANKNGTHIGRIWSGAGTQLASVTFSNETPSGWQQAVLSTPLTILANTTYVVSVNTTDQYYVDTIGGLAAQTTHGGLYSVVGANGIFGNAGAFPTISYKNSNYFRDVVFAPAGATGTTHPAAPTGLTAITASASQVNLSWIASTGNSGTVAGYKVYRDGAQVGTVTGLSYADTGLLPDTVHIYAVSAYDAAGNISAQSTAAIAITQLSTLKLAIGNRIVTTANVNVRQTASISGKKLGVESIGRQGMITGGPTSANNRSWWNVAYDNGITGWSVADFLVPVNTSTTVVGMADEPSGLADVAANVDVATLKQWVAALLDLVSRLSAKAH